jgi:hypothetical protein
MLHEQIQPNPVSGAAAVWLRNCYQRDCSAATMSDGAIMASTDDSVGCDWLNHQTHTSVRLENLKDV